MNKEEIREKQEVLEKELAELKQDLVKKDLAILQVIWDLKGFPVYAKDFDQRLMFQNNTLAEIAQSQDDYFISIKTLLNILSVASEGGL